MQLSARAVAALVALCAVAIGAGFAIGSSGGAESTEDGGGITRLPDVDVPAVANIAGDAAVPRLRPARRPSKGDRETGPAGRTPPSGGGAPPPTGGGGGAPPSGGGAPPPTGGGGGAPPSGGGGTPPSGGGGNSGDDQQLIIE